MASATPDLRLSSQLSLVPNLYCLVTVDCQDINPIAYLHGPIRVTVLPNFAPQHG